MIDWWLEWGSQAIQTISFGQFMNQPMNGCGESQSGSKLRSRPVNAPNMEGCDERHQVCSFERAVHYPLIRNFEPALNGAWPGHDPLSYKLVNKPFGCK